MKNLAGVPRHAAVLGSLKNRMGELRRELGDVDPPGPAPIAAPCEDGHMAGYPAGRKGPAS